MNFNVSPAFCIHNGLIILEQKGNSIVFGMLDENNITLRTMLEKRYMQYLFHYLHVEVSCEQVKKYVSYKNITKDFLIKETSRKLSLSQEQGVTNSGEHGSHEDLENIIHDGPIVHLLNSLLLECIAKNGSDIHIEPFSNGSRIRMRTYGELELYSTIDIKTTEALVLRILFLSGLDITEKRRTQDGSFHFESGSIETEVRVSALPSHLGTSCVLRLLPSKSFALTFSGLGFPPQYCEYLEYICTKTHTLFLVCGATGAGKSTTLAAMLYRLGLENKKIITIEDPVEYKLDGVIQIPINPHIDMDFSHVLRSTFRHDPDVIMIGEIRDEDTARIAVRAALTGHLVLASIHTLDAPSSIIRLLDMGIEHWLLSSVFGGALCQRLEQRISGQIKHMIPFAEVLPSCSDVSKLILQKASVHELRDWMDIHSNVHMVTEGVHESYV